jgi:hypothetical protein
LLAKVGKRNNRQQLHPRSKGKKGRINLVREMIHNLHRNKVKESPNALEDMYNFF